MKVKGLKRTGTSNTLLTVERIISEAKSKVPKSKEEPKTVKDLLFNELKL